MQPSRSITLNPPDPNQSSLLNTGSDLYSMYQSNNPGSDSMKMPYFVDPRSQFAYPFSAARNHYNSSPPIYL